MVDIPSSVAELLGGPLDGAKVSSSYLPLHLLFSYDGIEFVPLKSAGDAKRVSSGERIIVYKITQKKPNFAAYKFERTHVISD